MAQNEERTPKASLTPAELQEMRKCLGSSIWTHSFPAMVGSAALLHFMDMKGHKLRLWVRASILISSGIVGRFAAIPGCIRHVIQQVPDGSLAEQLQEIRSKRGSNNGFTTPYESHEPEQEASSYDIPITRPSHQLPPTPEQQQTYDNLRRQNRDEFMSKKTQARGQALASPEPLPSDPNYSSEPPLQSSTYYDPPSPYADSHPPPSPATNVEEPTLRKRKRFNKYGDEIED